MTNKSKAILISAGVCVPMLLVGYNAVKKEVKKPNIIYFLVDDMGYGDLSMFGQKKFNTPNIDRLASEGMAFSNHYTGSTVSGPSRACLITGKHVGHGSVRGNQPTPQTIGDNEQTIATVLKSAGYKTACIGKWGIGHPIQLDDPQKKGFDYHYGYLNMWHAHNCFPEFLYRNGEKEILDGNKLALNEDGSNPWAEMPEGTGIARMDARTKYAPDLFENEALKFIEENSKSPFFLYYALNLPHANNEASPNGCEVPSLGEFANKDWPEVEKGFAQMMRIIDNQVGAIMAKLDELGIAENSIIMFATDNGPHQEGGHTVAYFNSNGEYRGKKRDFYDGGIKTPFFVRWRGKIPANSSSDHLSAFWDILPTVCELTDQSVPEGVDGISLLPTLMGKPEKQQKHKYLYFEFYEEGGKQSVVSDSWKYIKLNVRSEGEPTRELYDLSKDVAEQTNVIDQFPQVAKQMDEYAAQAHTPFKLTSLFKVDGAAVDMPHN